MKHTLLQATEWITKLDEAGNVIEKEVSTKTLELSDRIAYALERSLIGLIIVFGVLAIIWLMLSLFKFVFYKDPNKSTKVEKVEEKQAPAVAPEPASVPVSDDGAIVAAIIAAISALRSEEGITGGFRVVSFKRGKTQPWNKK